MTRPLGRPDTDAGELDHRLLSVLAELSAAHHLDTVVGIVRDRARGLLGCDGVTFVLRDGEQVYYRDESALAPLWKGRRFPATECISGWVILQRAAAVIEDVALDARIPQEAYRGTFVRSLLMVPIRTSDPIGAIGAYWATTHRATPAEVDALQALADATALAVRNAELWAERLAVERALESREAELRLVTDAVPALISFIDAEHRYRYVNRAYEAWFDRRREEIQGKHMREVLGEQAYEAVRPQLERALAGVPVSYEAQVPYRAGGSRWIEASYTPERGPDGAVRGLVALVHDRTERKSAERRLAASEARLRQVIEHTPAPVAMLDRELRYLVVSERWATDYRLAQRDLVGRRHYDVFPETSERWREVHRRALAGHVERRDEEAFPRADGSVDWLKWEVRPWHDDAGGVGGVVIYSEVITHMKQAIDALREGDERFRALADNVPQLAWMADERGWLHWYNRRWYEYTGTTLEQMQGWGWRLVHHPDHVERVVAGWTRALEERRAWEDTFPLRGRDGTYRWFLSRAVPIVDEETGATRWFGTNTDITAEREIGDALRATQRDLTFLAEASKALASSLDHETTLATVSRLAVPTVCDWCVIDLVQHDGSLRRVVHAHPDAGKVELAWALQRDYPSRPDDPTGPVRVVRTGKSELIAEVPDASLVASARSEEHLRVLRGLGLRSYLCVPLAARGRVLGALSLATSESGRIFSRSDLALAEELARRMASAIENAGLYQDAQRAVHARDVFLSIASHELRTPLVPLTLLLQNMMRTLEKEGDAASIPRLADRLARAEKQVVHLQRLVNGLLDVSRLTEGRLELQPDDVDLSLVVAEVVERARPTLQQAGSALTLTAGAPVPGRWDRLRLEQVIENLLGNATKYGAGHPVEVVVRAEPAAAVLEVRDHGIGISPGDQERIFGRFERAVSETNYSGFGLGLWISRQIVEAMGGTIHVASLVGEGSTFTVRLPLGASR